MDISFNQINKFFIQIFFNNLNKEKKLKIISSLNTHILFYGEYLPKI